MELVAIRGGNGINMGIGEGLSMVLLAVCSFRGQWQGAPESQLMGSSGEKGLPNLLSRPQLVTQLPKGVRERICGV